MERPPLEDKVRRGQRHRFREMVLGWKVRAGYK